MGLTAVSVKGSWDMLSLNFATGTQPFVRQEGVPVETALRVYRRYLKLEPGHAEEFIEYLKQRERWNEAAKRLAEAVNDDSFVSLAGKTKHQLWLELCDMVTKHPADVKDLPVEAIIRGGIRKYTNEVGRLWTAMADFFIRQGQFERARDVYDEAIASVVTVRDFSLVFDALTQFEESMLSARMEHYADTDGSANLENPERFLLDDNGDDVDLRLARLERLTEKRPELLSSVKLRQNPHNVLEWLRRVHLFEGNPERQIITYTEAVKTIDPHKAVGRVQDLWLGFAKLYESHGDLKNAQAVFERATSASFKNADGLASVYLEWAEMLLRHHKVKEARALLKRATTPVGTDGDAKSPQANVHRNVRLWHLLCDLEESAGSLETAMNAYERALDFKVATPQLVLNYAAMLREHGRYEGAFRAYERGASSFGFPHAKEIWLAYLSQFVQRYGDRKLERARDLFEQAITAAPPGDKREFLLGLAKLEEDHGLARRAMDAYQRACHSAPDDQKLEVAKLYASKALNFFGVGKARQAYEELVQSSAFTNEQCKHLCQDYAQLERRLGEIERARALYSYASQFANPKDDPSFWDAWHSFEVQHGNESTFREMLRIKRSIAAAFSKRHFNTQTVTVPAEEMQPQRQEEPQATGTAVGGFVSAGATGGNNATQQQEADNPEEVDIGADAAEGEGPAEVEEKGVPEEVYGGIKRAAEAERQEGKVGALERFKRQRAE